MQRNYETVKKMYLHEHLEGDKGKILYLFQMTLIFFWTTSHQSPYMNHLIQISLSPCERFYCYLYFYREGLKCSERLSCSLIATQFRSGKIGKQAQVQVLQCLADVLDAFLADAVGNVCSLPELFYCSVSSSLQIVVDCLVCLASEEQGVSGNQVQAEEERFFC